MMQFWVEITLYKLHHAKPSHNVSQGSTLYRDTIVFLRLIIIISSTRFWSSLHDSKLMFCHIRYLRRFCRNPYFSNCTFSSAAKFAARIAAQIPNPEPGLIALGNFCGLAAHPFVVRRQDQALLIEEFPCGGQGKAAVFAIQKPETQFPLQSLYLLGNGGLRNEIFLSCLREAV